MTDVIESLRQQLAECERERDALLHCQMDALEEAKEQLATVTAERDELVRIADGIRARMLLRGFYVPQDTDDLINALAKLGADKTGEV